MNKNSSLPTKPIVLIHKGNSNYLPISLWQLVYTQNQGTPIYLIGNEDNAHFGSLVTHLSYNDFISEADAFTKAYKHYSTNGHDYELFCIQRWFILKSVMKKYGWQSCIYLDSDIMAYTNLADAPTAVMQAEMTVACISAHTNFINCYETLDLFCRFIIAIYSNPEADIVLEKIYNENIKNDGGGGVSDMTMFTLFRKKYPEKIVDISTIIENQTYDITIDYHNGYEMEDSFKKIYWQDNIPYCKVKNQDTLVKQNTLHFQGSSKGRIADFQTKTNINFWLFYIKSLAIYYIQKVKKKFLK
jgi:hypothetical protein